MVAEGGIDEPVERHPRAQVEIELRAGLRPPGRREHVVARRDRERDVRDLGLDVGPDLLDDRGRVVRGVVEVGGPRVADHREAQVGELAATTFGVQAMPLIRYRTGDCAAIYDRLFGKYRMVFHPSPRDVGAGTGW